jgi:outer membrane protein OmpA-like peptidoglycan-associated protein
MLIAEGSGNDASIQLVFDRDIKTGMTRSDIGWGHGWIQEEEGFEIEPSRPKRARIVKYDKEYEREDSASFQLSSATIRHDGRQDLRIFAANELALLRDPDARLDITGFADRLGGRWYNDVLSLARANNALQALQDCTGGIGATANTKGHGERHLAALGDAMGFPDSSASPEWRRVFLVLNGVASISLRVIDLEDEP